LTPEEAVSAVCGGLDSYEIDRAEAERLLVAYIKNRIGLTVLANNEVARERISRSLASLLNPLGHINALEPKPGANEGPDRDYG
jgi:hypothetical protein